jgi:hypothetical protein
MGTTIPKSLHRKRQQSNPHSTPNFLSTQQDASVTQEGYMVRIILRPSLRHVRIVPRPFHVVILNEAQNLRILPLPPLTGYATHFALNLYPPKPSVSGAPT